MPLTHRPAPRYHKKKLKLQSKGIYAYYSSMSPFEKPHFFLFVMDIHPSVGTFDHRNAMAGSEINAE